MTPAHPSVDQIFSAALALPAGDERMAYLDAACETNAELRQRVERLLKAHADAQSFLEAPAMAFHVTIDQPLAEKPGTIIGPYKLLQQIGEGGMGVVYMAEQTEPVKRRVALKLIKAGMDSRQIIARFEAERQALAMMDHVNIARVLDAGTTEAGRPYFVMELVNGVPITKYCDDNRLTPRQRLELFVPVCQAIQHAHQKGIIHRDIKPSNVMVTLYDGKPVPKVIDFGVAKATEQKLTERTLFTQFGTMVGTLEYMSPEQAEMSALGVDTRSDIYSLGVLLYELLTGSTPLTRQRLKDAAFAEILRMIKEDEPPKPSTRLSDSGESLASISAHRQMEPAKLTKLVRGELDWIVMKTLEKDRNRRYETANAFAQDMQRYLADETVQACPPSALYRFRKFARRNKSALVAVSLVMLSLVAGVGISTWQAVRANDATRAERSARQDLDIALKAARASEESAKVQEKVALESAKKANAERARATRYSQQAAAIVNRAADRIATPDLQKVPELAQVQSLLLEDLLSFYQNMVRSESADPSAAYQTAGAYLMVGDTFRVMVRRPQACDAYRKGIELLEPMVREFPERADPRQVLATCHAHLGTTLKELNQREEAEKSYRRAMGLWARLGVERPHFLTYRSSLRNTHLNLGSMLILNGRKDDAKALCAELLAPFEKQVAAFPGDRTRELELADACSWAADLFESTGRTQEAVVVSRRAIVMYGKLPTEMPEAEEDRWNLAQRHNDYGSAMENLERLDEAEKAYRNVIALSGDRREKIATAHGYLEDLLKKQPARRDDAIRDCRAALNIWRELLEAEPTNATFRFKVAGCSNNLFLLLKDSNDADERKQLVEDAIQLWERLLTVYPNSFLLRVYLAAMYFNRASLLFEADQLQDAEREFGRSADLWERIQNEAPKNADYRRYFLLATVSAGRIDRAKKALDELTKVGLDDAVCRNNLAWRLATSADDKMLDPEEAVAQAKIAVSLSPDVGAYWNTLGVAHFRSGDDKAAIAALEKSMQLRKGGDSSDWFVLAMARWRQGDKDNAREWYDRAVQAKDSSRPNDAVLRRFRAEAAEMLGGKEKP